MCPSTLVIFSALLVLSQAQITQHRSDAQKWPGDCESQSMMPPEAQQKMDTLENQLWEFKLKFTRLDELHRAMVARWEIKKAALKSEIDSLKTQSGIQVGMVQMEKSMMKENCDLRVQLIEMHDNAAYKCQVMLRQCQSSNNNGSCDCEDAAKADDDEVDQEESESDTKAPSAAPSNDPLLQLAFTGQYHISDVDQKETWSDARARCQAHGMDLVNVETAEENRALVQEIGSAKQKFWTSGMLSEGKKGFKWAATEKPFGYTNWHPGQPMARIRQPAAGRVVKCVAFMFQRKHKWKVFDCNAKHRYICELVQ